jgi:hypothetical protein
MTARPSGLDFSGIILGVALFVLLILLPETAIVHVHAKPEESKDVPELNNRRK